MMEGERGVSVGAGRTAMQWLLGLVPRRCRAEVGSSRQWNGPYDASLLCQCSLLVQLGGGQPTWAFRLVRLVFSLVAPGFVLL